MTEEKRFWRLELDYDGLPREDVETDAKRLAEQHPELEGNFRIEQSKSGGDHYHVIFPKSQFSKFENAYNIAIRSRADRDWLALCREYECFGLETDNSRVDNEFRQQKEKERVVNRAVKKVTSPYILELIASTSLDGRRITKVCEAIKDSTWQYATFTSVMDMKTHIQIGCVDEAQATRRMKWLSEQELGFTATVKENKELANV